MPAALDQTCSHGTLASDAIVASLQGVNKNYGDIHALRDVISACAPEKSWLCSVPTAPARPPP
ncbi:MAG TPA: hypothetical protein VFO46_21990 [Candidatus Sulfotelmatobacter sp.]|nr:hypothetical protein [Candidatus Sulfotelmatobacter sp.]